MHEARSRLVARGVTTAAAAAAAAPLHPLLCPAGPLDREDRPRPHRGLARGHRIESRAEERPCRTREVAPAPQHEVSRCAMTHEKGSIVADTDTEGGHAGARQALAVRDLLVAFPSLAAQNRRLRLPVERAGFGALGLRLVLALNQTMASVAHTYRPAGSRGAQPKCGRQRPPHERYQSTARHAFSSIASKSCVVPCPAVHATRYARTAPTTSSTLPRSPPFSLQALRCRTPAVAASCRSRARRRCRHTCGSGA